MASIAGPALTTTGEMLTIGEHVLVQLKGEQGDPVNGGVVAKPVAGHADLAAADLGQHAFIGIGPRLDGGLCKATN